jgi:hypothetical protein
MSNSLQRENANLKKIIKVLSNEMAAFERQQKNGNMELAGKLAGKLSGIASQAPYFWTEIIKNAAISR